MKNSNNQNGRSMIEMLGVLAIIGVLSVGGIAGYSKAMMKYRINKTIEQITLIAGNMRTFFASQPADTRYSGLLETVDNHDSLNIIRKAHLVPDEMFNPEGESACDGHCMVYITNAFGGPVRFQSSCGIDLDETGHCKNSSEAIEISFQGIPQEACIDIASQDWSNLNPELIYINTGLGTVVNSGLRIKSVDDAITNCSSASDNTIKFLIK